MRINYNKVISQAGEISQNAKDLKQCVQMLEVMEDASNSAWQGAAANEFRKRLNLLRQEINRTSQDIENVSRKIRSCAKRIKNEDELAAQRATQLK